MFSRAAVLDLRNAVLVMVLLAMTALLAAGADTNRAEAGLLQPRGAAADSAPATAPDPEVAHFHIVFAPVVPKEVVP